MKQISFPPPRSSLMHPTLGPTGPGAPTAVPPASWGRTEDVIPLLVSLITAGSSVGARTFSNNWSWALETKT